MAYSKSKERTTRVIQFGLGPIGKETAKVVLQRKNLKLVGAIDIDPSLVGRDIGEVLGLDKLVGIKVSKNAASVFGHAKADVVLHTTSSFFKKVYPQLEKAVKSGLDVISSTEELLVPSHKNAKLTERLDKLAKENRVSVLGTGVNPGFVMDSLVLMLTGVCTDVKKIWVERVVDAGKRRLPLQKKVGAGISIEEFNERKKTGTFGHIGLIESLKLIAEGLGWKLEGIEETLDAMVADRDYDTKCVSVKAGWVTGIKHIARGIVKGLEAITLDLRMYVGAENPHDSVRIDGTPPVNLVIDGGIMGDIATVAMLVNSIPKVLASRPGVLTMRDIPLPSAYLP
jgi:4-hydroxy-tetrahydrodipicolinate reductase